MKAYNKSEVDIIFSGWEEDLKQLSEIEVVSVDVLDKIIAEIQEELKQDNHSFYRAALEDVVKIIDRYRKGGGE